MIKKHLLNKSSKAYYDAMGFMNNEVLRYSSEKNQPLKILDVGIGEGKATEVVLRDTNNYELYGIDVVDSCKIDGVNLSKVNVEKEELPYEDNYFDIVYSNQFIEHLLFKNEFIKQCYRVLKNEGIFLTATENIASIDNILSLILGQEPLNQHSSGTGLRINTFVSPHFRESFKDNYDPEYGHKNVPSYFSLKRMVEQNGYKNVEMKSFGGVVWPLNIIAPFYNRVLVVKAIK